MTATSSATLGDHPEVVGDQDHRHPELLLESLDQGQDLGLDRDVERGGGLVGDQDLGVVDERHRDHHPLAHPARELVRVFVDAPLRVGDSHQAEQLHRPLSGRLLGDLLVGEDRLDQLLAHLVEGVQGGERVLEDHRDVVAAHGLQLVGGCLRQVLALEQDPARDPRRPATS